MPRLILAAFFAFFAAPALAGGGLYPSVPGAVNPALSDAEYFAKCHNKGWTREFRPPLSYTGRLKSELLRNSTDHNRKHFELDHETPLCLAGHPRSRKNLWLQSWKGPWNAKDKDALEWYMCIKACESGDPAVLHSMQHEIQDDWIAAYKKYQPDPNGPMP